jgi:hypothetical protein
MDVKFKLRGRGSFTLWESQSVAAAMGAGGAGFNITPVAGRDEAYPEARRGANAAAGPIATADAAENAKICKAINASLTKWEQPTAHALAPFGTAPHSGQRCGVARKS